MKKKTIIAMAVLAVSLCSTMSCSNDDYSYDSVSVEARVQILKQKFLNFANQYGVRNISFDDDLLRQHLDLTDDQIETSIIRLAYASGVLDMDASTIRKKRRTRSIGDDESNVYHESVVVEGHFSDTKTLADSVTVSYTIHFYKDENGVNSCTGSSATLKRKILCGPSTWIEDPETYTASTDCTISLISGAIPNVKGSTCYLDVHYNLLVQYYGIFEVDEWITGAYSGAEATVINVIIN